MRFATPTVSGQVLRAPPIRADPDTDEIERINIVQDMASGEIVAEANEPDVCKGIRQREARLFGAIAPFIALYLCRKE